MSASEKAHYHPAQADDAAPPPAYHEVDPVLTPDSETARSRVSLSPDIVVPESSYAAIRSAPAAPAPAAPPAAAQPASSSYDAKYAQEAPPQAYPKPTPADPFSFPTAAPGPPPPFTAQDSSRVWAVPQIKVKKTAPFLVTYPPALIHYGIPEESWCSFVWTVSAFLTANVSQRAVSHAGDVAASWAQLHVDLGKSIATHTVDHVRNAGRQLSKGNLFGVVGGTVGWAFGTVGRVAGGAVRLPGALTPQPKTPRERAEAYIAAANRDWFLQRRLQAVLVDTQGLGDIAGIKAKETVDRIMAHQGGGTSKQLEIIGDLFAPLVMPRGREGVPREVAVQERPELEQAVPQSLQVANESLWIALVRNDTGNLQAQAGHY